jgi:hypothetical protein
MAGTKKASVKTVQETMVCTCCGKEKSIGNGFYVSNSILYKFRKKLPVCKECVWSLYDIYLEESNGDEQSAVYRICRLLDIPYLETPFQSAIIESEKNGSNVFKVYMKNINSLKQYSKYTFENGDSIDKKEQEENLEQSIKESLTDRDRQNESDVIRLLGYDPFESENIQDRKFLFNRLVDMLDDSTLEDNVKLMSVISMVKGFNQIEYVDQAIALLTSDITKLNQNNGGIKSLIDTKKNLTQTVLKLAEDNGISTKFNTSKSKGSGTLTGMVKQLSELNLEESQVNLFDIQTADGMKQVADMSNESIKKQLQFDENDYSEMVAWQRDELYKLQQREGQLTEENRKLKIQLAKIKLGKDGE